MGRGWPDFPLIFPQPVGPDLSWVLLWSVTELSVCVAWGVVYPRSTPTSTLRTPLPRSYLPESGESGPTAPGVYPSWPPKLPWKHWIYRHLMNQVTLVRAVKIVCFPDICYAVLYEFTLSLATIFNSEHKEHTHIRFMFTISVKTMHNLMKSFLFTFKFLFYIFCQITVCIILYVLQYNIPVYYLTKNLQKYKLWQKKNLNINFKILCKLLSLERIFMKYI